MIIDRIVSSEIQVMDYAKSQYFVVAQLVPFYQQKSIAQLQMVKKSCVCGVSLLVAIITKPW